jgi:hypothetical protein
MSDGNRDGRSKVIYVGAIDGMTDVSDDGVMDGISEIIDGTSVRSLVGLPEGRSEG